MIDVVAALIYNSDGDLLMAQRQDYKTYPGYWEFPGGKVESGETSREALDREIKEELAVDIISADFWRKLVHKYSEKTVNLSFWQVTKYSGAPISNEGQILSWFKRGELKSGIVPILAANMIILEDL